MIKDLEGQMTSLTIENALLNDAVSDLERDLGDAEFEIVQLLNTVAILSAGGGGGQEVEYEFVGFVDIAECTLAGFRRCSLDWVKSVCENDFGPGARMMSIREYGEGTIEIGVGRITTYFVASEDGKWGAYGRYSQPFTLVSEGGDVNGIGSIYQNQYTLNRIACSAPI